MNSVYLVFNAGLVAGVFVSRANAELHERKLTKLGFDDVWIAFYYIADADPVPDKPADLSRLVSGFRRFSVR